VKEHRFTKGVTDYASGALVLVRSRVAEHERRYGRPPSQLVLHLPTARRLFTEFAQEQGLPPVPEGMLQRGAAGAVMGIPFLICNCQDDWAEDQIIDWAGFVEPL
jgi:hypothetical protein